MVTAVDGRWHPGIGDPNTTGWITVVAYLLAFWLCARCARRSSNGGEQRFWTLTALVMLLLGVNKQLVVQSWLTYIERDVVLARGWYEHRRMFQALFIFWLGIGVLGVKVWLGARLVNLHHATRVAGMGLLLLGAFVVLRAASFHHVDAMLNLNFSQIRINALLELGAIAVIVYGAWSYLRSGH